LLRFARNAIPVRHARPCAGHDDKNSIPPERSDALAVIDPTIACEQIKPKALRPPSDWANYGQMTRIVLNILRSSSEPQTTKDIALQMMVERALSKEDQRLLNRMTKRVGVALRPQRDNEIVRSWQGPGMFMLWEIARDR